MSRLRIRIELNRGGVGVPLHKLASVVEESQKFFCLLTEDVQIDQSKGEWLGFDFGNESLNFTAEFVGPVTAEQVTAFHAAFDGTTSLRRATISQFARITDAIEQDELIGFGLYLSDDGGEPTEWRCLSRRDALRITEEIQLLIAASGEEERESHLPAVAASGAGARVFSDRRERGMEAAKWAAYVREVEANVDRRITRVEQALEGQSGLIEDLHVKSSSTEDTVRKLLTAVEGFCAQTTRQLEAISTPAAAIAAPAPAVVEAISEAPPANYQTALVAEPVVGYVPIAETVHAPAVETVQTPIAETIQNPIIETTHAPIVETTQAPIMETVQTPIVEDMHTPIAASSDTPVVETVQAPISEAVKAPFKETAKEPESPPVKPLPRQPATQPSLQPRMSQAQAALKVPPSRPTPVELGWRQKLDWRLAGGAVLLVAGAVIMIAWAWQNLFSGPSVQRVAATSSSVLSVNTPSAPSPPAGSADQSQPTAPPSLTQQSPAAGKSDTHAAAWTGQHVTLQASELTWVSAKDAAGTQMLARVFEKGDTKTLDLPNGATVRVGNAGGLSVLLNGTSIGAIGAHGQVRNVIFRNGSYKVVASD